MIEAIIKKSKKLTMLLEEVEQLYSQKAVFIIDDAMDSQGAFDYQKEAPTFVFRTNTLNDSNIAHELIHALQFKRGFTFIVENLTADKRFEIIKELNSNILHISLVAEMGKRDIEVKSYIQDVVKKIKRFIKDDKKVKEMKRAITERKHYDALSLMRLEYEAIYLSKVEKEQIFKLYKTKYPEAYDLFLKINYILCSYNMLTIEGVHNGLKEIINLFNEDIDYSAYIQLSELNNE
jgi:hypothetical protein